MYHACLTGQQTELFSPPAFACKGDREPQNCTMPSCGQLTMQKCWLKLQSASARTASLQAATVCAAKQSPGSLLVLGKPDNTAKQQRSARPAAAAASACMQIWQLPALQPQLEPMHQHGAATDRCRQQQPGRAQSAAARRLKLPHRPPPPLPAHPLPLQAPCAGHPSP